MLFLKHTSEDSKSNLNYLKSIPYWHRPVGGLVEVVSKMQENKVSNPTLLGNDYMELYIGSFLCIALQENEGLDFWIAKPHENPPDFVFMTVKKIEKNAIYFHSREVEITRYVSEEKTIEEIILKKDTGNKYPPEYVLVCFIETTGTGNMKKLAEELRKKLQNINHVFLIFHGVMSLEMVKSLPKEKLVNMVSVVQLLPEYNYQMFNIQDCVEKAVLDTKKLVYLKDGVVYEGLRDGDTVFPRIINN